MLPDPIRTKTFTLDIYIKLAQYPILADEIRERMRQELFKRGVISDAKFEDEVRQKAIESQLREGLYDPFSQEPAVIWQERLSRIRDYHTDFYFGYNLPADLFNEIVQEVLRRQYQQVPPADTFELTFNPELAPWEMLFRQGERYEALPPPHRDQYSHHLEEMKVVLIKGMISDQLPYIGVAKRIFTVADLRQIYSRRIGTGKIGGKAAGMLLAWKTLQQHDPEIGPDVSQQASIPDSFYLATDVIYDFRRMNRLDRDMNQKYRPLDEIREDYPRVVATHLNGRFPEDIVEQLRDALSEFGRDPIILRSSSLLEDNFGYSFAGKYQSYFCPNQGSENENLEAVLDSIRRIYASTLNPDAILYRQKHGLIDYDERMAILIQRVRGKAYGRYYFPTLAGVGFSQNPFRWNPKIRREEGFLRLVWGIGTRAVDRVDRDYPRLIALSHPELRPETAARTIRQYAQHYVDVIDLEDNAFRTLPVNQILSSHYPELPYIASIDKGDYLQDFVSRTSLAPGEPLVLTFDYLTKKDRKFVTLMRTILTRLEKAYQRPVDIEFTVDVLPGYPYPSYKIHVLQCRPLSQREEERVEIPGNIPLPDVLFRTYNLIPDGKADGIRYVIFVDPRHYRHIPDQTIRLELARAIGRLNKHLENEPFILMGPGRWGSANIDLGVRVSYADIYNTKVLIEIAVAGEDGVPELSYGTHFFQDLVEAGIHSLPLHLEDPRSYFNWYFFTESPNVLAELSPQDADLAQHLRVIDVPAAANGRHARVLMNGVSDEAVGYLV